MLCGYHIVSDQFQLGDVAAELDESSKLLEQYKKQLQDDIDRRTKLIALLSTSLEQQEEIINKSSSRLKVYLFPLYILYVPI